MLKICRIALLLVLFSYIFLILDAYVFGFNKFNEKVIDYSFIRMRKGRRYFMYTEKGKINIEYDLYATLLPEKIIQVYRSKVFGNAQRVEVHVGDVKESFDISFTRSSSGRILISLFFLITSITLIRLKYIYPQGRIGMTVLALILLVMIISGHFY